jgi:predicted ester cyclase
VVTRWTFRGTHTGTYMGVAPSGRQLTVSGVHIHRIVDGKIVEVWAYPDALDFLQQLGVIPPLG